MKAGPIMLVSGYLGATTPPQTAKNAVNNKPKTTPACAVVNPKVGAILAKNGSHSIFNHNSIYFILFKFYIVWVAISKAQPTSIEKNIPIQVDAEGLNANP